VHDGDTGDDVAHVGTANDHALGPVAVEAGDGCGVEVIVGPDEVDVALDQAERSSRPAQCSAAVRSGCCDRRSSSTLTNFLSERKSTGIGCSKEIPSFFDEPHVLDDESHFAGGSAVPFGVVARGRRHGDAADERPGHACDGVRGRVRLSSRSGGAMRSAVGGWVLNRL
jgi:hypothetical protein